MSKDFLVTDYTFSPGVSGAGYVDLYNLTDFDITRVVSIINQTKGEIIYATGIADKRYTSISGRKVYLNYNTSTHSSTDKLQIIYNTSSALKTADTDTQEMIKLLSRLVKIAENQQATDVGQRQRIAIDSAGLLAGNGTAATALRVTMASDTTGILANITANAGMNQEQYINIARNAYSNSIRNKLFFG